MKAVCHALFAATLGCASVEPLPAADAATFREKIVYSFAGGADGARPNQDLLARNGDPMFAKVPVKELLSKSHAATLCDRIDPNAAANKEDAALDKKIKSICRGC